MLLRFAARGLSRKEFLQPAYAPAQAHHVGNRKEVTEDMPSKSELAKNRREAVAIRLLRRLPPKAHLALLKVLRHAFRAFGAIEIALAKAYLLALRSQLTEGATESDPEV